jgi:hypothetical protein
MTLSRAGLGSERFTASRGHPAPDTSGLPLQSINTALGNHWANMATRNRQSLVVGVSFVGEVSIGKVLAGRGKRGRIKGLLEFLPVFTLLSAAVKCLVQSFSSLRLVVSEVADKINLIHKNQKTQIHQKANPQTEIWGLALSTKGNGSLND